MAKPIVPVTLEPLAVPFKQFYSDIYPMSRAKANICVANGELRTFLDGARRMVLLSDGREFVERRAARGGAITSDVRAMKSAAGRLGVVRRREIRAQVAGDTTEAPEAA
jgi:hypothetical protein